MSVFDKSKALLFAGGSYPSMATAQRSEAAADRAEAAEDAAADYAASATGSPQFAARATAEAATIPAFANTIFVEGQAYRLDPAGTDLVTAGGVKWTQVRAYDQFPSEFTRTVDPAMLRAAIGLDAVRDNSIVNGTHILDATMFQPSMTVYSGNGTFAHLVDVSTAVMGQVYPVYNAGSFGDLVTLDCGEELSFVGFGAHPAVNTRRQITIEAGTVAFICRASINKVWVWIEGTYWAQPNANARIRLMDDGTYDVRYTRTANIAATTEVADIVLPTWMSLDTAVVRSVAFQPRPSGATGGSSYTPPVISKMGTTHGLAANVAAIYNPGASAVAVPIIIHFSGVTRVA